MFEALKAFEKKADDMAGEKPKFSEPENDPKKTKIKNKIIQFIKKYPDPTDDLFHAFAMGMGMEPDELETIGYSLLSDFLAEGKYREEDPSIPEKKVEEGAKVEMEHTDNPEMAKRIAKDHITEHKGYYPALKQMEDKLKAEEGKAEPKKEETKKEAFDVQRGLRRVAERKGTSVEKIKERQARREQNRKGRAQRRASCPLAKRAQDVKMALGACKAKKKRPLSKKAGGPGSGNGADTKPITKDFPDLKMSPLLTIGKRGKFLDANKPIDNKMVKLDKIKFVIQEKYVPEKVERMTQKSDEVLDKACDMMKDSKGDYHMLDGHHRFLTAKKRNKHELKANVYKAPKEA